MFSVFFSQKDLKNAARVNKNFRKLSDQEITRLKDKYADNIFYTVVIQFIFQIQSEVGLSLIYR